MNRTELIAALEAAEGPSQELDGEIAIALLGRDRVSLSYVKGEEHEWQPGWPGSAIWLPVPHYTESIDAALSFTPEGWRVHEFQQADDGRWRCRVVRSQGKGGDSETGAYWRATPAIALCIANLRALEAQEEA